MPPLDPFSGTPGLHSHGSMLPPLMTPGPDMQAIAVNHRLGKLEHALSQGTSLKQEWVVLLVSDKWVPDHVL